MNHLTVEELILQLQKRDPKSIVVVSGHADGHGFDPIISLGTDLKVYKRKHPRWSGAYDPIWDTTLTSPDFNAQYILEPISAVYLH